MIVDSALREREARGNPIRVGMVGAGATGRAIALEKNAQPAGAIDDGNRYAISAFGERRLRDRQGHVDRNVLLRQHLRAGGTRNNDERSDCGSGGQTKRH